MLDGLRWVSKRFKKTGKLLSRPTPFNPPNPAKGCTPRPQELRAMGWAYPGLYVICNHWS